MKCERRKFEMVLVFAVLFATLAFVSIGCASGTVPPEEAWNKTFGGNGDDEAYFVQQTSDGGYIVTGNTRSYGAGSADVWLIKTDSFGNKQWNKTFGGSGGDYGYSVQQTSDGGYIIAGSTHSYAVTNPEVWLIKTNGSGNEQWNKTLRHYWWGLDEEGNSVQQTSDGGYIIAGKIWDTDVVNYNVGLIKTNSSGDMVWDRSFGGTCKDWAESVQQTIDGGYILVGTTGSYGGGGFDVWLIKTDVLGYVEWDRTFVGSSYDYGYSVQQTSDGGYIFAGCTYSYGAGEYDFWLVKTDSDGNEQWNTTFGGTDWDVARSVQQTSDGGYILAGYTGVYDADEYDSWLVKTDSEGNEQWNKTFGGGSADRAHSVQQTAEGGYILAGETWSYDVDSCDFWVIKVKGEFAHGDLNGDGNVTPADAAIALQLAVVGAYNPAADVSGDSRVTSLDALMILQAAAGAVSL